MDHRPFIALTIKNRPGSIPDVALKRKENEAANNAGREHVRYYIKQV